MSYPEGVELLCVNLVFSQNRNFSVQPTGSYQFESTQSDKSMTYFFLNPTLCGDKFHWHGEFLLLIKFLTLIYFRVIQLLMLLHGMATMLHTSMISTALMLSTLSPLTTL